MGYAVNLAEIEPDQIESGGQLKTPGYFRCVCDEHEENKRGDGSMLTFRVTHGRFVGSKAWVHLKNPDQADNPKQAANHMLAIAKRMGLCTKEQIETAKAKGESLDIEFVEAIGCECFIEMEQRKDTSVSPPIMKVQPAYIPIYPLDDPRVPNEARKEAGLAPLQSSTAKSAAKFFGEEEAGSTGKPEGSAGKTPATKPDAKPDAKPPAGNYKKPVKNDDFSDL